jgi:hypothetical protein
MASPQCSACKGWHRVRIRGDPVCPGTPSTSSAPPGTPTGNAEHQLGPPGTPTGNAEHQLGPDGGRELRAHAIRPIRGLCHNLEGRRALCPASITRFAHSTMTETTVGHDVPRNRWPNYNNMWRCAQDGPSPRRAMRRWVLGRCSQRDARQGRVLETADPRRSTDLWPRISCNSCPCRSCGR